MREKTDSELRSTNDTTFETVGGSSSISINPQQINPGIENMDKEYGGSEDKDPWANRSGGMKCKTCMFYVKKGNTSLIGRCRRNAPTMKGYPVVYPEDWCGEHKMDEEKLLCG